MLESHKNANRFAGFAGLYDSARPACPIYVTEILTRYLGQRPRTVIDIGCGTGLSTLVWRGRADRIIGVEPSGDMLTRAMEAAPDIEFVRAFSDDTGLPAGCADIITCSQSFHWMEPVSTLREIARLLRPGGVFAAYDCDWPPVCGTEAELAYEAFFDKVIAIERSEGYKSAFVFYPKENHLEDIRNSGYFIYSREIVFANAEQSDAERLYNIALSQGAVQAILKKEPALIETEMAVFRAALDTYYDNRTLPVEFCYRLRLGVKKD